jgi:hypothetical protein
MLMAKTKRSLINNKLYLILALLFMAGFFIFNHLSVQSNKRNFEHARTAIDSVYSGTTSVLGNPDAHRRVNTCGGSQCTVYTSFVYAVDNKNQADEYFKKIQTQISSQKSLVPTRPVSSGLSHSNGFDGAQDLYSYGKLTCTAKYTYNPPQITLLRVKNIASNPLYVELGCTGAAKKNFYPSSK